MTRYKTGLFSRAAPLLLAALIAGSTLLPHHPASAGTLDDAKANGVVIALANEPPYSLIDADGKPGGWGPEMDQAILQEAGIAKFSGQLMEYGAMVPALQSKRVSLTTSGALYIKPQRCEVMLFSAPVSCVDEAFILPKALGDKVKSFKDVAAQGLKIGVCSGCADQKLALEAGIKEENIVLWPDATSGVKLLSDKRIDVFVHDSSTAAVLLTKVGSSEMRLVHVEDAPWSCVGAGFNKDDAELRDAYNEGLRKIRANGKFMEINKKYGIEGGALAEKATTEQLCAK